MRKGEWVRYRECDGNEGFFQFIYKYLVYLFVLQKMEHAADFLLRLLEMSAFIFLLVANCKHFRRYSSLKLLFSIKIWHNYS